MKRRTSRAVASDGASKTASPSGRTRTVGVAASRNAWTFADATPPLGLRVRYLVIDGVRYAVFSFPLPSFDEMSLTATERDVVIGVCRGLSNVELAMIRNVSPRTIANQLSSIYRKLSIVSRAELLELLVRRTCTETV